MGLTTLRIGIGNPNDLDRAEFIDFLVDSGATYSVVPADKLDRLGIKRVVEEEFRLADGSVIRRWKGVAGFRLDERVGGADVIFGEQGDSTLLGALTLGALGLGPLKRELKPLPMSL